MKDRKIPICNHIESESIINYHKEEIILWN